MEKAMIYMYATMLLVLSIPHQTHAAFTIFPSSQVVGVGQMAEFRCQNPNAEFLSWRVNETRVNLINPHPDSNISFGSTRDESNNVVVTLRIIAQLEYNETMIICTAISTVGDSNSTTPVKLLIQGPLSMVTEIKRNSSTLSWEAPFSLDLTGVDPNIIYCVEVYNITCGVDDLMVSDCNVTEFVDNRLQQGYIYRITITPRSNGQDAQNGTSNTIQETFTRLNDARIIIIMFINSSMVNASFQFSNKSTGTEPAFYSIALTAIDEIEELSSDILATSFVRDTSSTNVSVIEPLPRRRLWNYQVLPLDCNEHPITSVLELSTHDFQSVTVSSPSPGLVRVTSDFINGSSATSVLIIIYSTDNRNDVYYMISSLSTEGETLVTNISSLLSGPYNISVFVLEENGLPFIRSASTPRNVSVEEHQGEENGNFLIEYEVHTDFCITCTFLESSTNDCVVVVHQQISELSSSGLMNIESSYKFNRSGDTNTARGCIEPVDLELYQIGVVRGRLNIRRQPNQGPSLAGPIAGTILLVCVVVVAVVVAVVLFIVIHKRQAIHEQEQEQQQQQQQQPGDSSSLKPLTTPPSKGQDEEAYDVLQRGPPKTSASKEVHDEEAYSVLQREPLQQKTSASKAGVHYLSVNLGPSSGVMVPDLHKTTEQYSELQQQEAEEEEESFNEGAAAGSADNRCSDGGDATQGDLHLDLSDESVPCCFHSIQGPTMTAELTRFTGDQRCAMGEEATVCITQCTDEGSTDGQTYLLTLDGKQTSYVQGHRRYLYPVIVRASGVCNEGQHKDITLYTKFL